jgi:HTH-type transcriptional regulator/antitoxin HigA
MKLKPIKNNKEYQTMLDWVDIEFDNLPPKNSERGEQLQIALLLIKSYEDEHFPIPTPDAIAAIKLKMLEKGIRNKDLVEIIGSKGYISAILNKRKPLTLEIAKIFHKELGVPANVLLA